ncbi:P-loop containing nucleoside triphosphate hydrolase protein, partial [Parathielavia appendiculata]
MGQLGTALQEMGVQVVLLTATLAPADVGELYAKMRLDARQVRLFRSRTTRRNIGYRVRVVSRRDEGDREVRRVVQAGLERYSSGKIIVYGGEVERVERLGEMLSCPVFHSKVDTAEGKGRRWREWVEAGRVIVTTNALGMGIDVADVRMVVHAGPPRRLRDYAQESGRAGRDGEASEAVIVWPKGDDGHGAKRGKAKEGEAER